MKILLKYPLSKLKKNDLILIEIEKQRAIAKFNFITSENIEGNIENYINITIEENQRKKVDFALLTNNEFINEFEYIGKIIK